MTTPKTPRTFMIYARKGNRCGYLRFVCRPQDMNGERTFMHTPKFVKKCTASSLFVNFDNTRRIATGCVEAYGFEEVSIVDSSTGKVHNVKTAKPNQG